jgi:hypothetical protein
VITFTNKTDLKSHTKEIDKTNKGSPLTDLSLLSRDYVHHAGPDEL